MAIRKINWAEQEFEEIVLQEETRIRTVRLPAKEEEDFGRDPNDCVDRGYMCKNCQDTETIKERYDWKKVRRVPNPVIFGKDVKSQVREIESNLRYYCTRCHAENKDVLKIASQIGGWDAGEKR